MAKGKGAKKRSGKTGGKKFECECNHCHAYGRKATDCFFNPKSPTYKGKGAELP